jgi:hypothetical protein
MRHLFSAVLASALLALSCGASAQSNPAARPRHDAEAFNGHWNGAHLEQRSECASAQNNGFHGTYGDFSFRPDAAQKTLTLDEVAITGLVCNYFGAYRDDGRLTWSGNMSCTDNRTGTFDAQTLFVHGNVMEIRMAIRLDGAERCAIDAIVSGAHL